MNIRDSLNVEDHLEQTRCGCRLIARSDDGGKTFAALWQEPDLWSSGVEGSMITTPATAAAAATSLGMPTIDGEKGIIWFSNPRSKTGRVNGTGNVHTSSLPSLVISWANAKRLLVLTVYYSIDEGSPGSWVEAGRVPGEVWKAGPGRPLDTFNFGYNMMVVTSQAICRCLRC